jgi:hypothetical protein
LIGGGNNYDASLSSFIADYFQELSHLAAAFAHKSQHRHIGTCPAGHHTQQGTFSDTAASKNTNTLTASAGHEGVESTNAAAERLPDRYTIKRLRGRTIHPHRPFTPVFTLRVKRYTSGINHST